MDELINIEMATGYAAICGLGALVGGIVALFLMPKPWLLSFLYHLSAGVLMAVMSISYVPQFLSANADYQESGLRLANGFLIGGGGLFFLRQLLYKVSGLGRTALILASALDFFVDGVLIALAFTVGQEMAIVVVIALALRAALLNINVSRSLMAIETLKMMLLLTWLIFVLMPPLGAFLTNDLVAGVFKKYHLEVLSFVTAALLYKGIEPLISEPWRKEGTLFASSGFFFGFLILLIFQ